jgi:hypothetical protein
LESQVVLQRTPNVLPQEQCLHLRVQTIGPLSPDFEGEALLKSCFLIEEHQGNIQSMGLELFCCWWWWLVVVVVVWFSIFSFLDEGYGSDLPLVALLLIDIAPELMNVGRTT